MPRPRAAHAALLGVILAAPAPAAAQRYPLLDSTAVAMLSGEISGDAAYDHVRVLTSYHRPQGSDTLGVAARYVEVFDHASPGELAPVGRTASDLPTASLEAHHLTRDPAR